MTRVHRSAAGSVATPGSAPRSAGWPRGWPASAISAGPSIATSTPPSCRSALGGLKGPLMKAAQLLATIPDALPPEYARELAQLQANAPAMGWAFVKRRMATELGPDWQAKFAKFDKEASFAASLGQVHHAILPPIMHWGAARWRPSCSIPTWPRHSRPTSTSSRSCSRSASASTRRSAPTRSRPRSRTRLREELDYRREAKHVRALSPHAARRAGRACAGGRAATIRPTGC